MKNILFCGNDKVFDGILTAMLSIFMRTKSKEPFTFFIFTMDVSHLDKRFTPLSDAQANFLDETAKSYNPENKVQKIDVTKIYMENFSGCPNENCYCSPYTLIRLFADVFTEIPDKILYLDADILFNRDIDLIWNTDIENFEYAAARDHYGKILLFFRRKFINAGVILFNMKKCRETKIFEKARSLIKTKKLLFADESALIESTAAQKILSQRFNDQKFLYKDTVIRHFSKRLFYLPFPHTANIKQWNVTKVHKVFGYENFDDIFFEYIYLKKKFEKS
ncbi:MAG: glycosyltransferase [Treponema sp.]|nr:glycosyltransferase [Treponema sp.]